MSASHISAEGSFVAAPGPVASSQLFRQPTLLWAADNLAAAARATTPWLWRGYLALGALTMLFGRYYAGKTTLASVLLARLQKSGEVAGLSLAAANAIVVSGEATDRWQRRSHTLDFGDHVGWFCQPFRGEPRPDKWLGLIDEIAQMRSSRNIRLVVIDPLAAFMHRPGDNSTVKLLEVLTPLQRLTAVGLAVLALHDRRKTDPPLAEAVRGSGALADHVDIAIEMHRNPRATDDDQIRRRVTAIYRAHGTRSKCRHLA
jgi:AAA domain